MRVEAGYAAYMALPTSKTSALIGLTGLNLFSADFPHFSADFFVYR
jgi:hypothetical protein